MLSASIRAGDVAQVVREFDRTFREMELVAWRLSQACRGELLGDTGTRYLEELVWLVKRRMGIQGVGSSVKGIAAHALKSLPWRDDLFESAIEYTSYNEKFAHERLTALVELMLTGGAGREEYSLASKVLHWLLPHHVPVYDKNVRTMLGITGRANYAYGEVVRQEFAIVRRLLEDSDDWIGDAEPFSPLRAIDKYLWWRGGGSGGTAYVSKDPWAPVRHLGLGPTY